MDTLDLLQRLSERAALRRDAPAIIEPGGKTFSHAQIAERARATTRGFIAAGLQPGDRVLFAVRPSAWAITLMTGIAEAGGVLVPAVLGVGDALFEAQMGQIDPRWVVAESTLIAASFSSIARRVVRWRGGTLPSMECVRGARFVRVGPAVPWGPRTVSARSIERLGRKSRNVTVPQIPGDAPAIIVFTSGTTGAPKAVVHGRRSLRATLDLVGSQLAIGERDTLLSRELHLILPALFVGARVVVSRASHFSPGRTLRLLDEHRVTHMFGVTADCQALLGHVIASGCRLPETLRQVLIGAAPVHASFLRRFQDVLPRGAKAWCVYGMTEMLPVACIELEEKLAFTGDGDVVGAMVEGASARVSDAGELILRGDNLFTGYLGQPSVSEHHTGDLARIDEGRIVLIGRQKDMIIRREHNIYPALHEPVIESISGVRRCAMVGVYDDEAADERIVLAVEVKPWCDNDAFVRALQRELREGQHRIDAAAQPDFIFLTPLPGRGRSSKVDRDAVRQLAREKLACASR